MQAAKDAVGSELVRMPIRDPAKTTTVEALLGILSLGAMTGYEIRQTIEDSIGNFWSESFGQIYPTLKRMVREGTAEQVDEVHAGGRTGKKVYRLTDAGRGQLEAWLKTPSLRQVPRNEMLLKIFFAGRLGPEAAEAQVKAYQAELEQRMRHYQMIRTQFVESYDRMPESPYWRMTLEFGIAETAGLQMWCRETLRQLAQMQSTGEVGNDR